MQGQWWKCLLVVLCLPFALTNVACSDDDDGGGECDRCNSDSDCNGELSCVNYSDGIARCADGGTDCPTFSSEDEFVIVETQSSAAQRARAANWLAVDDLDADGISDLVRVHPADGQVAVWMGDGVGRFPAPELRVDVGVEPEVVELVDLDGDEVLDLLVLSPKTATVSTARGNGDATFQTARQFDAGLLARAVTVIDVDHDGALDLVLETDPADREYEVTGEDGVTRYRSTVLFGDGDGTFQAPTDWPQ